MKQYFLALVLAAAFAGPGQAASVASTGTAVSKPSGPAPRSTANRPGLSDAQIERNIKARLARSKISLKEHFTVSVKDGVATLEGKTNVIQHKGVATRLARLGGALAVQNQIQISEEARAKAAARLAMNRTGAGAAPVRATVIQAKK